MNPTVMIESVRAEYLRYKSLAEAAIHQLDDEQLSAEGPNGGNSIAVICWHIAGNLQSRFTDFLTTDGEKPWRHREEEFHRRAVTRDELLAKWRLGWDALDRALAGLTDDHLTDAVTIRGQALPVHDALHRSVTHASYHVGQIVYLAKALRGADWQYLSIAPGQSEAYNRAPTLERPSAHQARLALAGRSYFRVVWGAATMSFEDMSGLDLNAQASRSGSVLLRRGVFTADRRFWDWFNQSKARRVSITVSLVDATGRPTRVVTLMNAWPVKVTGPGLNASGNEVAIETIEIAHDGLGIASA